MTDAADAPILPIQVVAERSHVSIPSLPNWIEPTVEYLRTRALLAGACQETRSGKLLVALHEAITNALVHGNLGLSSELKEQGDSVFAEALAKRASDPKLAERRVDIVTEYDGEVCHWIITDQGDGFDVEKVLARCLSDDPEVLLSSGRGILMMKSFLDDVRFDLGGRRVILSLRRESGAEKRRNSRVSIHRAFQVTPLAADGSPNWGQTYEAMSRNFSEHGVALLQDELAQSQRVLIGIRRNREIVYVPAEIKHTRALEGGGVELGCRFLSAVEEAQPVTPTSAAQVEEVHAAISDLLSKRPMQLLPADERRTHPRVIFNDRVNVVLTEPAKTLVGYARDLSHGGMAFIAQEPLHGEVTIVFLAKGNQPTPKVRGRVVRCGLIQEGFYDVGVAFSKLEHRQ